MIDGGPLHGGASAELVINDEFTFVGNVADSFKPVIGIAFFDELGGELKFQLVSSKHRLVSDILQNMNALNCTFLPVLIVSRKHNPPPDATPEPVG